MAGTARLSQRRGNNSQSRRRTRGPSCEHLHDGLRQFRVFLSQFFPAAALMPPRTDQVLFDPASEEIIVSGVGFLGRLQHNAMPFRGAVARL